jgi:hypothetical protein
MLFFTSTFRQCEIWRVRRIRKFLFFGNALPEREGDDSPPPIVEVGKALSLASLRHESSVRDTWAQRQLYLTFIWK